MPDCKTARLAVAGIYALKFATIVQPYIGKSSNIDKRVTVHLGHLKKSMATDCHPESCCVASYAIARAAFRAGDVPILELIEAFDRGKTCNLGAMEYSWWDRKHGPNGWQSPPHFAAPCGAICDHLEIEEYLDHLSRQRRNWHASRTREQRREHALRIHAGMSQEQRAEISRRANDARSPERRREIARIANAAQSVETQSARQKQLMANRSAEERAAIIAKGHARKVQNRRRPKQSTAGPAFQPKSARTVSGAPMRREHQLNARNPRANARLQCRQRNVRLRAKSSALRSMGSRRKPAANNRAAPRRAKRQNSEAQKPLRRTPHVHPSKGQPPNKKRGPRDVLKVLRSATPTVD